MQGSSRVDELMIPVANAISRHVEERTPAWTDIYNRAYEAVYTAIREGESHDDQ